MRGLVQSVERAAAMLRLLADGSEPMELGVIADALGLPKGTAHGLLRTLKEVGFVEQDVAGGPYRVAADVFRLGPRPMDLNELRSHAVDWADALAARTGESVRVAAFADGHAVTAHHVFRADGSRQVLRTGTHFPLHASALGKVLLAFEPGAARSLYHAELEPLTGRTTTDRRALQRELAEVRDLGHAVSVEEQQAGLSGIASPIRDHGGYVVAAVGIEGPPERLFDDKLRPRQALVTQVLRAGRSISRELGHGRHR
ncbi:IclR family transcriptional regulator [Amycolatopsis nigrescens]|uniref:IclR family transcriptional regulator n=1 Tax=Amycolatopsis nigrescens TaxID=381445 RepID=UPI00039B4304|nr:IclR family transcriptional regulator [Amycolatopsis nigrescens]